MARHRRARRPIVLIATQMCLVLALTGAVSTVAARAFTRGLPLGLDRIAAGMGDSTAPDAADPSATMAAEPAATPAATDTPIVVPVPAIDASAWQRRGEIVSSDRLAASGLLEDSVGDARRALYRSTSGLTGAGTEVSGTFFVPRGDPPVGGWPVISMAHSTTGLTMDCGLSIHPDLLGFDKAVKFFLDKGMAVAMTDYEGLGAPGVHPFLEPSTAAFNVIDAVRALRALFPAVSPRWVALGSSQGGQAAWAASELDELYGEGVDLIGSVALAPGANLSGLADLAFEEKLTRAQLDVMPHVTVGAQRSFPSAPLENLLHGDALERTDLLISCDAMAQPARQQLLTPDDVKPATRADADALSDSLRRMALPRSRVTAPLLVVSGLDDQVVPPSSIRSAVERACRMGGQIEFIEIKGAGHAAVGPDERVMTWIGNRFARIPAPSDCAVLKGTT